MYGDVQYFSLQIGLAFAFHWFALQSHQNIHTHTICLQHTFFCFGFFERSIKPRRKRRNNAKKSSKHQFQNEVKKNIFDPLNLLNENHINFYKFNFFPILNRIETFQISVEYNGWCFAFSLLLLLLLSKKKTFFFSRLKLIHSISILIARFRFFFALFGTRCV